MKRWRSWREDDDFDRYDGGDEGESGYCSNCKKACTAITVDNGIGPYEYWGAKGVHHDYATVSDCCEDEVLDDIDGAMHENRVRFSTHIARKDHKDGKIKKGDKYWKEVFHNWRTNGPSWWTDKKRVIKRAKESA